MATQGNRQSFLERLTGTVRMEREEELHTHHSASPVIENEWEPSQLREEDGDNDTNIGELAIDMYESDNELVIQSMIAGVTPEHLNITVNRDSVIIRGKRVEPQGIDDNQYLNRELYWGEFERVIQLPFEVNTEGAEAVEKYGLLIIRLPRVDSQKTQKLQVRSI